MKVEQDKRVLDSVSVFDRHSMRALENHMLSGGQPRVKGASEDRRRGGAI